MRVLTAILSACLATLPSRGEAAPDNGSGRTPPAAPSAAKVVPAPKEEKKKEKTDKDKDKEEPAMASMNAASLLPVGVPSHNVRMPEFAGDKLVSRVATRLLTRLDEDRLDLVDMRIERFRPDGGVDYTIVIQRGTYSMDTGNLVSKTPTSLRGESIELDGEGCVYSRQSSMVKILGKVHSRIYLKDEKKKTARAGDASPEDAGGSRAAPQTP